MVSPLMRTMRLIASSHTSGVVRRYESRRIMPVLLLGMWQLPHLAIVSASVMGIPAVSLLVCAASAAADATSNSRTCVKHGSIFMFVTCPLFLCDSLKTDSCGEL